MCKVKKSLSMVLAVLMIFASFGYTTGFSLYADNPLADEWTEGDFLISDVTLNGLSPEGKLKLSRLNGNLEIPKIMTKQGTQVSKINRHAFEKLDINSLKIADGIESIDSDAFRDNNIKKLVLPDSVTFVFTGAFSNNKISDLTLSENMEALYAGSFESNLLKEVYIPEKTKKITIHTFQNNPGDTENGNKVILHVYDLNKIEFVDDDLGADRYIIKTISKKDSNKYLPEDFTYEILDYKLPNGNTVKKNSVTGFSKSGKEKLKKLMDIELPSVDTSGNKVLAVGRDAFKSTFGVKNLNSVLIPEGYENIGQMAFAFCGIEGNLKLPESLETLELGAFFRNNISSVNIPKNITVLTTASFRGNKLSNVTFEGDLVEIQRLALAENKLVEITVPDSLKIIGEQAFKVNTGSEKFDDKVVIRTKSGKNPNKLEDKENYLIDPKGPGVNPDIDYTKWEKADFSFENQTVKGFSKQGLRKVKKNKNLIIPESNEQGKPITIIGIDAFRNLQTGFDLESVEVPETVERIENYAFQFNPISKFKMPRDLKYLGYGVFMDTDLKDLTWNDKIEEIDQICFYDSKLGDVKFPKSLKFIRTAAFRNAGITSVIFEKESKLEEIDRLAFANNSLKSIDLPEGLKKLNGEQIFAVNGFTEITIPDSLTELGFQTFLHNKGLSEYGGKVVVHTKNSNKNNLSDDAGGTYVVDPDVKPDDNEKKALKNLITEAEKVDQTKLTDGKKLKSSDDKKNNLDFKKIFVDSLEQAKKVYENNNSSKANTLKARKELEFYLSRAPLNQLMFTLDELKKNDYKPEDWKRAVNHYITADKKILVYNLSKEFINKITKDLDYAIKNLQGNDPLKDALKHSGEAEIPKSSDFEPYKIKVNVWVKDGIIVHVEDNETVTDDLSHHHHAHNAAYWEKAKEILGKYDGKSVKDIIGKSLSENGIDAISKATVSCNVIHLAVRDAIFKDKSVLILKINEANAIDKSNYTDETVNILNQKLTAAQIIKDKTDATEEEISKASKELDAAIKALVRKPGNNDSDSSSGSSSSGNSSSGSNTQKITDKDKTPLGGNKDKKDKDKNKKLPFADVKENYWAYNSIYYTYFNDLFKGVSDTKFDPEGHLNRAMFVTVFFRLSKENKVDYKNTFTDVESGWYEDALNWAVKNGIVNGMNQKIFAPNNNITREQMVKIMYEYAKHKKYDHTKTVDISNYKDSSKISEYAVKPMKWAIANNIIKGMSADTLDPQGIATRAQASAIIERFDKMFK